MRIPFVDFKLYNDIIKNKNSIKNNKDLTPMIPLTKSRSTRIIKNFSGLTISVYNGKLYNRLKIKNNMIGHNLGEFIWTKKLGSSIHNSEKNRKKIEKQRRKITQKKVRKTATTSKTTSQKKAVKKK